MAKARKYEWSSSLQSENQADNVSALTTPSLTPVYTIGIMDPTKQVNSYLKALNARLLSEPQLCVNRSTPRGEGVDF